MCWLLTYFFILIQNELRVVCNCQKLCPFLFMAAATIFACTFMNTLFTSSATANQTQVALIYIVEKITPCVFLKDISCS